MTTLTEPVPVPGHIPPEAVYDFDLRFDPGLLANPHERVRELLREAPPVFWTPRNGGRWVAIGHREIFDASRDPEHFSSSPMPKAEMEALMASLPADMPRIPQAVPILMDPPEHTRYRAPLQGSFSPKAVQARKESIRELANELIDAVVADGHCDFIPAVAEPLPVRIFLRMMGLPEARLPEFRDLVHEFLAATLSSDIEAALMGRKVADAMLDVIQARREDPQDDLISLLWATEIDGRPMTLELMEDYAVLLFIAGLDTVINGMGFGVRHLAANPELQAQLRADPSLIPDATEELLRRYTFTIPVRRVAQAVELGGWQMLPGDWLALYLPGADLDPREYESPEEFTLKRQGKAHIAFGAGVHRCLGSHLARVELQVLYTQMLERLPPFRLDPQRPAKFHSGNIIALDSLPLRWD
ncbi:cytochrome P450 [Mangrovimicrobium sediminis]|uniref:Cytochrome P450 n=1 Tax=Mangrovimicrobium sediminis TaxID=2562682 RepID=A0A4Z0LV75_9GAMM|nr:cytochrome P450 [Haliea sp. SAOS-164]TGD71191.1 cytochrome P450 [Haliea sp. SAOS-164]